MNGFWVGELMCLDALFVCLPAVCVSVISRVTRLEALPFFFLIAAIPALIDFDRLSCIALSLLSVTLPVPLLWAQAACFG